MSQNFIGTSKRGLKILRNTVIDPLPRSHVLTLEKIHQSGNALHFDYHAKRQSYVITLHLPEILAKKLEEVRSAQIEQVLTAIGIAFSAFFFKLTDFKAVIVKTAPLDFASREFFEQFFVGGLGEFRYLQGLDPTRKVEVIAADDTDISPTDIQTDDSVLMLNGGGKDTAVAAELMALSNQKYSWLTVGPNPTREKIIELSGVHQSINVGYSIDRNLTQNGIYGWGHTPRVSIFLSIGLLVAILTNTRYVAAGNELSANYGNVRFRGADVNHQYTKSFVYEQGFSSFVRRRVTDSIKVFSILRPFHDLQLAEFFASRRQYHGHFVSCNEGIGRGEWCKSCPKCAFTALAIAPFVETEELRIIFGDGIFSRTAIRRHIIDLVSGAIKPWECVGTREECTLALALLLQKYPEMDFSEYPRRRDFEKLLECVDVSALKTNILEAVDSRHLIPTALVEKLNAGLQTLSQGRLTLNVGALGTAAFEPSNP